MFSKAMQPGKFEFWYYIGYKYLKGFYSITYLSPITNAVTNYFIYNFIYNFIQLIEQRNVKYKDAVQNVRNENYLSEADTDGILKR